MRACVCISEPSWLGRGFWPPVHVVIPSDNNPTMASKFPSANSFHYLTCTSTSVPMTSVPLNQKLLVNLTIPLCPLPTLALSFCTDVCTDQSTMCHCGQLCVSDVREASNNKVNLWCLFFKNVFQEGMCKAWKKWLTHLWIVWKNGQKSEIWNNSQKVWI